MNYEHLRVMVIGAHPDDPENCGGLAIKFKQAGHTVKFVSVTNGQSGHQEYPGFKIVQMRSREMENSRKILGIDEYVMLDANDGYLTDDLCYRDQVMRVIREFKPDIIITHRTNDYHPDHRNTGLLVQDCSYLLRVPNYLPTVPVMDKLPLIFYMADTFQQPTPFRVDVAIDIDDVMDQRIRAYYQHTSQVFDWLPWVDGIAPESIPTDPEQRWELLKAEYTQRPDHQADFAREKLIERYGEAHGRQVRYVEALQACEYGASHKGIDYKKLFPF